MTQESSESSLPFKPEFYKRIDLEDTTKPQTVEALSKLISIHTFDKRPYFILEQIQDRLRKVSNSSQQLLEDYKNGELNILEEGSVDEEQIITALVFTEYNISFLNELRKKITKNDDKVFDIIDSSSKLRGELRRSFMKNKGKKDFRVDTKLQNEIFKKDEEVQNLKKIYSTKNTLMLDQGEIVQGYEMIISPDVSVFWSEERYLSTIEYAKTLGINVEDRDAFTLITLGDRQRSSFIQFQIKKDDKFYILKFYTNDFCKDHSPSSYSKNSYLRITYESLYENEMEILKVSKLQNFLCQFSSEQLFLLENAKDENDFAKLCRQSNENRMLFGKWRNLEALYESYRDIFLETIDSYPKKGLLMDMDIFKSTVDGYSVWAFNDYRLMKEDSLYEAVRSIQALESTIIPKEEIENIEGMYGSEE